MPIIIIWLSSILGAHQLSAPLVLSHHQRSQERRSPAALHRQIRSFKDPHRIPATMTPPALSPEKWPLSKVPVEMDTFSMITMLLRAAVTLRHRNDDLTLWAFRPTHSSSYMSCSDSDFEADFTTLEAFNGLLTPSDGVVAACYRDEKPLVVRDKEECTVDNPVLGSDNQKHMMPCHVVVMANADKQTNALEPNSNPLNLRFLTDGEDLWWKIKESQAGNYDPLDLIAR